MVPQGPDGRCKLERRVELSQVECRGRRNLPDSRVLHRRARQCQFQWFWRSTRSLSSAAFIEVASLRRAVVVLLNRKSGIRIVLRANCAVPGNQT